MSSERKAVAVLASIVCACGRLGYDPIQPPGAGGGSGGRGGIGGASGAIGASGAGGSSGLIDAGAGGTPIPGRGGSAGSSSAGAGGITGGQTDAGTDGSSSIACVTAALNGHDYAFCDAFVDWPTARAECESRGMRLARIDDAAENDWVVANIRFSGPGGQAVWVGGFEPGAEGDWRWTDGDAFWNGGVNGSPVGGLYINWEPGEPNNLSGGEGCLAIPLNRKLWYDYQCTFTAYFACERY